MAYQSTLVSRSIFCSIFSQEKHIFFEQIQPPCVIRQLSACRYVGMSACRHVGMSACRHVGMSACRHVGMSACRRVGVSACRRVGVSALRRVGVARGVPGAQDCLPKADIHECGQLDWVAWADFSEIPMLF
jgi:hypothetical protein